MWNLEAGEPHGSATVLTSANATEHEFKRLAPGRRILHLATHGFFLGTGCAAAPADARAVGGLAGVEPVRTGGLIPDSPFLRAGLALAHANRRATATLEDDDGILTAEEVASMNLSAVDWAVLSACDTGVGEIRSGEGVFGLERAFQIAGVRTVIMSLWSIEDQSTSDWMHRLYENRLGRRLSTVDSLRQATIAMLQARRAAHKTTHPYYWGAFVASGDWH